MMQPDYKILTPFDLLILHQYHGLGTIIDVLILKQMIFHISAPHSFLDSSLSMLAVHPTKSG